MSQSLRKKAIFLSKKSENWIVKTVKRYGITKNQAEQEIAWTESINASIYSLVAILKSSLPDLTENEWEAIFKYHQEFLDLKNCEVTNSQQSDLALKLHNMNKAQITAISYIVRVFLLNDWGNCSTLEIVEQIKKELFDDSNA